MVIGGMGQDGRPMVPVVVQGAGGQEKKFSCLLWTGFAGTLLLPTEAVAALGLTQTGTRAVRDVKQRAKYVRLLRTNSQCRKC